LDQHSPTLLAGLLSKPRNKTGNNYNYNQNLTLQVIGEMLTAVSKYYKFSLKIIYGFNFEDKREISHLILTVDDGSSNNRKSRVHIVVFHVIPNSSFYYTTRVPQDENYDYRDLSFDVPFVKHATIFDSFVIKSYPLKPKDNGNGMEEILLPGNIPHFVQQIPHSTYISCDIKAARGYRSKYPNANQTTIDTRTKFALKSFKKLMKKTLIPFWACSGTLLGKQFYLTAFVVYSNI